MRVLNLYAGIGGNRKLWKKVQVTAVESNPEIAKIYWDFFPKDKVIIADAHQYLLENFEKFDISKYNITNKRQILRNCVESELGLHVFECSSNQ